MGPKFKFDVYTNYLKPKPEMGIQTDRKIYGIHNAHWLL